jgi:hypothetical protein
VLVSKGSPWLAEAVVWTSCDCVVDAVPLSRRSLRDAGAAMALTAGTRSGH